MDPALKGIDLEGLIWLTPILLLALLVLAVVIVVLLARGRGGPGGGGERALREEMQRNREEITGTLVKLMGEMRESQEARQEAIGKRIGELTESNEKALEKMREKVDERLREMREGNEKKLEQMRETVDEKLQSTLEKRIGESFKRVSEHLEAVHKGLGEMRNLADGVGDLKKVLTNVKARGTWGEIQLGAILEQILTDGQYDRNVETRPNSNERVEFAIRLPGPEDDPKACVWLPVDAKFPQEDYLRLVEASEAGDSDAVKQAVTALSRAVVNSAKDIRDKYLDPPHTTDFAIMFVPTEGLYAEILRQAGLVEQLQRDCRVVVAGPTTLAAILSSLRMGFRTLAIEKRSSEVWKVLSAVKTEFGKFGGVLEKLGKQLDTAKKTVDDTGVRTRAMERKLRDVEALPEGDTVRLLGLPEGEAPAVEDDEEGDQT
jgi:DNA recombination protein RmuC